MRDGAYLLLALRAVGVARAVVGLRGVAQLLLSLQQLSAQARHVGAVGLQLRQRRAQRRRLHRRLRRQCVQRRHQRARVRFHALRAPGLRRHAVRSEVYLGRTDAYIRIDCE